MKQMVERVAREIAKMWEFWITLASTLSCGASVGTLMFSLGAMDLRLSILTGLTVATVLINLVLIRRI